MDHQPQSFENLSSQKSYAHLLHWATEIALWLLGITFSLYYFGILDPYIPIEQLPQYWGLSLQEFNQATQAPTGWHWLEHWRQGDYLNHVGIVMLAGVTGLCYLVMLFQIKGHKERYLIWMLLAELALILLSASDLLRVGAH